MKEMTESLVTGLEEYLKESSGIIQVLAQQEGIIGIAEKQDNPGAVRLMQGVVKNIPGLWAVFVVDGSGKILQGATSDGKYLAGVDIADKEFFGAAKNANTDDVYIDSKVFLLDMTPDMLFAISKRISGKDGQALGWIMLVPNWSFVTSLKLDSLRIGKEGYGFMYDADGRTIAHAVNKKLLFNNVKESDRFQTIMKTGQGTVAYTFQDRQKIMVYQTMPVTGWVVALSAYESDLAETALEQQHILIPGGIGVIIIIVGVLLVLIRKYVIRPIGRILDYTGKVAGGDLHAQLEGTFKYEFLAFTEKVQLMVAELKKKIGFSDGVLKGMNIPCTIIDQDAKIVWVNEEVCKLFGVRGKPADWVGKTPGEFYYNDASHTTVAEKTLRTEEAVELELTFPLPSGGHAIIKANSVPYYDMDKVLLGSVTYMIDLTEIRNQQRQIEDQNTKLARTATDAEEIAQHLSSSAGELFEQIEKASNGAGLQRDRMSETSAAMNEMTSTVLEVARNASDAADVTTKARNEAEHGAANLEDLIRAIGEVQKQALSLKESMNKLGEQAQGIGNVMDVITDIADQTNLLALNAAIEAARAGEAGRGFAVVADEVRKLAEKTMTATKEVGSAITNIQQVTDLNMQYTDNAVKKIAESTEFAGKSGEVLGSIVTLMESAASQVSGIATAAEEQSATSEEINQSVESVNQLSQDASNVMEKSLQSVQEVAEMATKLSKLIEQMS